MTTTFKQRLEQKNDLISAWLQTCLSDYSPPLGLASAMEYSLFAGGKRIRPVLCLSSGVLFGTSEETLISFACALECIHTYSLIHDDLPAMDNDDLRRGRPSNHKQYDEATAILAGDALLTDAFTFMTSVDVPPSLILSAIAEVAQAAGSSGMVGGQYLDMQYTGKKDITLKDLSTMHMLKTGALITASCVTGAILAGADSKSIEQMRIYGQSIGAAFQIMDDVLDEIGNEVTLGKPVGRDVVMEKVTYPSLVGLEESKNMAQKYAESAIVALEDFFAPEASFLKEMALYIVNRSV